MFLGLEEAAFLEGAEIAEKKEEPFSGVSDEELANKLELISFASFNPQLISSEGNSQNQAAVQEAIKRLREAKNQKSVENSQ